MCRPVRDRLGHPGREVDGVHGRVQSLGADDQPAVVGDGDPLALLLPGQRHDSVGVAPLLTDLDFAALLADKAFDSDGFRTELDNRGAVAVIPPKANRVTTIPCDFEMYKWRHLVENFFCQIKEFRRIATRYDKTDTSFAAMIQLVGSVLATR